jgi:hypothetical protein
MFHLTSLCADAEALAQALGGWYKKSSSVSQMSLKYVISQNVI